MPRQEDLVSMVKYSVRHAREEDAPAGVSVLRRSISELCDADHANDPSEIAAWLENKTDETWKAWVSHPDAALLVAEEDDAILGVGMIRVDGELLLNYVAPEARFQGVSSALLTALEDEAIARGAGEISLESTRTAKRFYLSKGYYPGAGDDPLRMSKHLSEP